MLYQGIIGGGSSPVEPADLSPVLLWTNPNPTENFSNQKISLNLTEYEGVLVEFNSIVPSPVGTLGCAYFTKNGNYNQMGAYISSDTGASGRNVVVDDTGVNFNVMLHADQVVPLKIYGVKKYVVKPVSGIQFSEFATMTASTDIDAVIGDYYILESRDTYSVSTSSSTTITGADKIIEKLDNLTTQKVAIYTTVIKATSNKFRCDKPGYYSHITLN